MNATKSTEITAVWLIILSGTLYGLLGYFGTQVLNENLSIPTMLFWRFFIATIWMVALSFFQKKSFPIVKNKKSIISLFLASIFYSGASVFYFYASQDTGTGLAMVIFFAYPIFVALMVWLKNVANINLYSVLSLITVSIGLFLLQKNDFSPIKLSSIILALLASLSYALYIYRSKKILNIFNTEHFTMMVCALSALVFLIIAITAKSFTFPHTIKSFEYLIGLSIFATALPIQLLLYGLKFVGSLKASILSALEPIVTLIVGVFALHEIISFSQLLGVLVILLGTIIIQFARD